MQHLDTELLSGYIDGELPAGDSEQVEAHLASCPQCQREFQELQGVARLVRELPSYQPRRMAHVRSNTRDTRPGAITDIGRFLRPMAVAAIVIIVAIAGLRIIGELTEDEPDDGAPGQLLQEQPDGTDEDRSASESVADAPDTAADEMAEPSMAAVQPGDGSDADQESSVEEDQESAGSGDAVIAPAAEVATSVSTQSPGDAGEPTGSSTEDRVRTAILVFAGAAIVGSAVWLLYLRTRRR